MDFGILSQWLAVTLLRVAASMNKDMTIHASTQEEL